MGFEGSRFPQLDMLNLQLEPQTTTNKAENDSRTYVSLAQAGFLSTDASRQQALPEKRNPELSCGFQLDCAGLSRLFSTRCRDLTRISEVQRQTSRMYCSGLSSIL